MASFDKLAVRTLSRRFVLLLWLDLLLVTLISSLSIAQTTTSGGLTGVVTDPSGAVVPDADVEIKNDSKGTTQSMKTDRAGVYRFCFLARENCKVDRKLKSTLLQEPRGGRYFQFSIIIRSLELPSNWG
jgi:Carboxypeptidase regulatory-like domain